MTRGEWVRRLITLGQAAGLIPLYRSDEWEQLPGADPRKFAAAVVAAECWRLDGTDEAILRRFEEERSWVDRTAQQLIRETSDDIHQAMTTPDPDDPSGRSILGRMAAPGYALTYPELEARRTYREVAA